ncbi:MULTISPECIES: hypothetical protein [Enterobacteriaceae]|uniref:hypothetical protein n=1 Tax=Enterobacteriaceae TaxID=543 RepID=UPI000DA21C18|nr:MULTISPECIES: hypothetical protein [Enterobacteriaceae]ECI1600726.1 hypothetical protein [Salmonella enterica subsp. enterica serovar Senftenberg]EAS7375536.1 hypothetical protein [Salmonella enterica]EAX8115640.1 hypothetical protein [Salmonella enterica]EAX8165929.1 hypothetical protein [Salmonella enterica]EAX8269299.1 hypothetical protein [Salmonella enterica]
MAKKPLRKPESDLRANFAETKKAWVNGAKTVNNTIAEQAGQDLKNGDGRLMKTYNDNNRTIDDIDKNG